MRLKRPVGKQSMFKLLFTTFLSSLSHCTLTSHIHTPAAQLHSSILSWHCSARSVQPSAHRPTTRQQESYGASHQQNPPQLKPIETGNPPAPLLRCVRGPQLVQTGGMQLSNSQLLRALLAQAYWCGDVIQVPLPAPQSVGRSVGDV